MREHKLFKVNQAAILQNSEGRVLILRKDGKWMLPGGRMEANENWLEGLKREMREETGILDFAIVRPASVGTSDSLDTYLVNFLCRVEGVPEVVLSSEHDAYEWVGLESLDKFEFWHPSIPERIKQALESGESYQKKDRKRGVDHIGANCVFYCHDGRGNVLFHKRSAKCRDEQGVWDSGAGAMEFGETFEETVRREVREEYGTEPLAVEYVATVNVLREHNGKPTHWIKNLHWVLVDPTQVKNGEPEKIDELGWYTLDNPPQPLHSQWEIETKLLREHLGKN